MASPIPVLVNDSEPVTVNPLRPQLFRVRQTRRELSDTFTLELTPADGSRQFAFAPGQFNMLYVFGAGEVPISISGDPVAALPLLHTIRSVGLTTAALERLKSGDTVGVRGPFGSTWPVAEAEGNDVVIVAGGVGLAPLRSAIYHVLSHRDKFGNICIFYGARTPADILFRRELEQWRGRFDLTVEVTVDHASGHWAGKVGVVTQLIDPSRFDAYNTIALVCGPEVMMRYAVKTLNTQGVDDDQIYLSLERNMQCATGFCGHCQFGPHFVCKDGPVFRYDRIQSLFALREF